MPAHLATPPPHLPGAVFLFGLTMKIIVNGKEMWVAEGITISALLQELNVRQEYTAVALNREVAGKQTYATTVLREGDRLEIVHPMGGG